MAPPLIPPLVALCAGILVSPCLDPFAVWLMLPLAILLSIAKRKLVLLVMILLGAGLQSLEPPMPPDPGDAPVRLIGRIRRPPEWRGLGVYLDLEVDSIDARPAAGRARLTEFLDNPNLLQLFNALELRSGDQVEVVVKLHRPVVYRNPGVFDFRRYLERQRVYWTGNIRNPRLITVLERTSSVWGRPAIDRIREHFRARMQYLFREDQSIRGLAMGMVLGLKHNLTAETERRFQAGGLYHLVVVSGFNLAVVAGAAMWVARRIPCRRNVRLLFVLVSALFYAAIVEGDAPVVRAALMVSFLILGRILDRGSVALNSVAGSALLILLIEPASLEDQSFQMTFAAAFSIVVLAVPATKWAFSWLDDALADFGNTGKDGDLPIAVADWRVSKRLWCELYGCSYRVITVPWMGIRICGELVLTSLCIEVFFTFFMVEYFHRFVPISPLLNVPAGLIAAAVTPLGLFLLLLPQSLAQPVAWIVEELLGFLLWLVDLALQIPVFSLRVPSVPPWLWLLYAFVAGVLVIGVWKRKAFSCLVAGAGIVVLQSSIVLVDFSPRTPAQTTLTFLDVGQGDSTLIELPDGQRVLIDGGGIAAGRFLGLRDESTFSIGEDVVTPYLFYRRIRRLDSVVLTHAHHDHLDGLLDVINNFEVGEVWLGRNPMIPAYRELVENVQERQIPIRWLSSGTSIGPFAVLHPPAGWRNRRTAQNDDSVVLLLKSGSHTALFTGDIERNIDAPASVDVLKISHHGSRSVKLRTRGNVPVVSVGANNPFGHPHPSILPALRTDLLGAIQVVLSDEHPPSVSALTGTCPSCKLTFLLSH